MKYHELESAYDSVNFGSGFDNYAFISKSGRETIYDQSDDFSDGERPEWVYDDEDYVQVPDKRELNLGTNLVWDFVREEIPGLEDKVREIFRKSGAYSRYKGFLEYNDLLEKWYEFENTRKKEALLEWCFENGIKIVDNKA